ncbi:MAG: ABC transporter permease [Plesiomonas sp.]
MKPGLRATAWREWQRILHDRWIFALTVWLPPLFFVLIWAIFNSGIPKDLPVVILDQDHSQLSRELTRRFEASPALHVAYEANSLREGMSLVRSGKAYALIMLPYRLDTDVKLHLSPAVTAYYNSQYVLIGKAVNTALQSTILTMAAQQEVQVHLATGENIYQALGQAVPTQSQYTPLYNIGMNYVPFLVTAVIPGIWQIFLISIVIAALGLEFRDSNGAAWLQSANGCLGKAFVGKMLPYALISAVQGALFLWGVFGWLDWPIEGSIPVILLAQWLMIGAYVAMGTLLYCTSFHYGRAASTAAAYSAPAFAFMGVTFPAANMPSFAKFWSDMLPISHYIQVQIQQVNYAASWEVSWRNMSDLLWFWLVIPLALLLLRARLRKLGSLQ